MREALIQDEGVRGLLLIHGLHPISLQDRLAEALDKVRPYMKSHGGDVELLSLEDDFARLRLRGHCESCPSSTVTLELAVRSAIEEACPDLAGFEVEGAQKNHATATNGATPAYEHTPNAAPEWTRLASAEEIPDGGFRAIRTENESLFVCKLDDQLYAYRDLCPACNLPLHLGELREGLIVCSLGHCFDVRRAGASPNDPQMHLNPVPLLMKDGVAKVVLGRTSAERRSGDESLQHEHTH